MSEPRLISPMLDNFMMGGPISNHHGVCCCPAMEKGTDERYIVKIISVPASPAQMDAFLLSGAFKDENSALDYYRGIVDETLKEVDILEKLSELEWFIPYKACQMEPMESGKGFEIYLLGAYNRTLQKHFKRHIFTHLDALNLGLDLCSALSMCRRNGYLYVDLKPSNIYVADQRLFRIGDLGFVNLDSLKYASLPDKYQSIYTPPEVRDAFSALNTTMDIYAAGLILYQAYNNGELPFNDNIKPGDQLPAPLYADYEIGEIILKACAVNPDDRWQDPIEMRQAIINYMQRNGAQDLPIVPMATTAIEDDTAVEDSCNTENILEQEDPQTELLQDTSVIDTDNNTSHPDASDITDETESDVSMTSEDDFSTDVVASDLTDNIDNPALITDEESSCEEDDIEDIPSDYTEITDEVSDMLNQADELASLDVPDPVVVPEHVDIPEPDPIEPEVDETNIPEEFDETEDEDNTKDNSDEEFDEDISEPIDITAPLKRIHWVRSAIIVFAIIALLAGGFYYYKNHYLLPIEYITVEGNKDSLTVVVTTDIDESILEVICSDTYGNKIKADVVNGKAEFTGLVPNTAYSIKVNAKGFHRLTGSASTAYSTPIQTNVVQFDAIAGSTEDSVILSFTAEGPGSDEWTVQYSAEGEETQTATFVDSQMVTITNLTVGKAYQFKLIPKQPLYLTGLTEISFTPQKLVRAEGLTVTSCINNQLTVSWNVPMDATVSGWSVRCHNETYSQTIVTTDTSVTFKELDHTAEFDIEVKAIGMSVSSKVTVPANSVTATEFNIDTTNPTILSLSWQTSRAMPEDGLVLCYSIVGLGSEEKVICKDNKATIGPLVPNATYRIHIEDNNGMILLGSQKEVTAAEAQPFQMNFKNFTLTADDLTFYMCRTPARPNWGRYDLSDDDYTNTFSVGQSASFLVRAKKDCYYLDEPCSTMFVVRDQNGAAILTSVQSKTWTNMWSSYNCKLEISTMPTQAGNYTIEVYFNGGLAHQQEFIIQ